MCCSVLQCVAVRCSVLQCCNVLQCVAVCCRGVCVFDVDDMIYSCSVLQCVAMCCRVLQCVAFCCSELQRVAVLQKVCVNDVQDVTYSFVCHDTFICVT